MQNLNLSFSGGNAVVAKKKKKKKRIEIAQTGLAPVWKAKYAKLDNDTYEQIFIITLIRATKYLSRENVGWLAGCVNGFNWINAFQQFGCARRLRGCSVN